MTKSTYKTFTVSELKSAERSQGENFESILLIRKISIRTAKNNNIFLMVELGDRHGSFQVTCFNDNPAFQTLKAATEGIVIRAYGQVEFYQGRLSPRLIGLDVLTEADIERSDILDQLVETTTEDPEKLTDELFAYIAKITHKPLRSTVENVFGEIMPAFKTAPAAISMHHAYRGGLLEHTIHMARAGTALLPLYQEVDPDLALSGILLHDIGKTVEYEGGLAQRRSRTGIFQGHVVLGYRMVRKAGIMSRLDPEILERLEHIVLSHQGELEWGAAAMAATPEAVFVSMVDNLDARMGMVQYALRQADPNAAFSPYLPGLKAPLCLKRDLWKEAGEELSE